MIPGAVADLEALTDAPRYQIAASFDPGTMTLHGTERVWMSNHWDKVLDAAYFRLYPNGETLYGPAKMRLLSVVDDAGRELAWKEEGDDTVIRVDLPAAWSPGESLVLTLTWDVQVPVEGEQPWTRDDGYGIFRQAKDIVLLAEWFPMLAVYDGSDWQLDLVPAWGDPVYSEIALFEVWLTTPAAYSIIATGTEVSASESGGAVTRRFLSGPTRDFYLACSQALQSKSTLVGETLVRSYFYPENGTAGEDVLRASSEALRVFNRRFGTYPYRDFEVVEVPLIGLLGMEYPGVTLLSDRIYTPDQKWRLDITAAHEVAHQWWYGVVGNDILNEPWLDEALATFSSGVYVEDVDGEAAFRAQYEQWVERYETGQRNGTVGRINWPVMRFRNSWDYVTTVYYEGAIFLERLRGEIGDTALFGALQQYYQTFGYRQAASEDFLGAIEQASGRHLDDFYARWLYKN